MNLGETADLICVADANPIIAGMFSWKWLVRATYIKKNVHRSSHPLNDLPFIWLPFLPFFLLAFANAQMHHISLALTILPPHLFLLHAQPKSRKIAFITAA